MINLFTIIGQAIFEAKLPLLLIFIIWYLQRNSLENTRFPRGIIEKISYIILLFDVVALMFSVTCVFIYGLPVEHFFGSIIRFNVVAILTVVKGLLFIVRNVIIRIGGV